MATFNEERIKHAKDIVKKITLPAQPTIVVEVNNEMREQNPDFQRIANCSASENKIYKK